MKIYFKNDREIEETLDALGFDNTREGLSDLHYAHMRDCRDDYFWEIIQLNPEVYVLEEPREAELIQYHDEKGHYPDNYVTYVDLRWDDDTGRPYMIVEVEQ